MCPAPVGATDQGLGFAVRLLASAAPAGAGGYPGYFSAPRLTPHKR
jgi:hypothetical protein